MYILTLPYGKMNLDANNGSSTCCSDECMKVVGIRSMNDSFMLSSMEQYCIVGQVSIIQVIAFLFDLHHEMQLYR